MIDVGLCVLIAPSAAGHAWREALAARAEQMGWPVSDLAVDGSAGSGLVFAQTHQQMQDYPASNRAVIIDTTATDPVDPSLPAAPDALIYRSEVLVQAEMAGTEGARVLNAARYALDFPVMGVVERREGAPYRIHPAVAESPLAIFDDLTPGSSATWSPRWFAYTNGFEGSEDEPLIDLTGRMRPIVHGPYIHLPPGRWRAELRFTVDPERGHAPLLFEWGSGIEFSRIMTEIHHPGTYGLSLDRIWLQGEASQLRIWPGHPVFQGRFGFKGCTVTRVAIDDPAPVTPTDRIVEAAVV